MPATHEVAAGRRAFQACRVDGRRSDATAAAVVQANRAFQHALHGLRRQQVPTGLLQRREVRHSLEPQHLAEIRMISELCDHASIIGLPEVLQHQTGEQLMLREHLGAVAMSVEWQYALGCVERRPRHRLRRFAGACHIFDTHPSELAG